MSDMSTIPSSPSAKKTTLFAMKLACIWIILLSISRAVCLALGMEFLTMTEIITSGVAIGAIFAPVYFSILADKFKEIILAFRGKNE